MTSRQMRKGRWGCGLSCWVNRVLRFAEFLQLSFPKSDHVSNTNTIAHVGKPSCKNSANRSSNVGIKGRGRQGRGNGGGGWTQPAELKWDKAN